MTILNLDRELSNADWAKQSWDLPPYKSKEFMDFLKSSGTNLEKFRLLPVYERAVTKGLIKNDEWQGVK